MKEYEKDPNTMQELETFSCSFVVAQLTHFLSEEKQMAARDTALDGQSTERQIAYLELGLRIPVHESKIYYDTI
jgi:hypothetical protein